MRAAPLVCALLLAALVSGCTEPAPVSTGPDPMATSSPDVEAGSLRVLRQSFRLHLTEANTGGVRTGLPPFLPVRSDNCLGLAEGVAIERGMANATWTSQSPATDHLLLTLDFGSGPQDRLMQHGPSTLGLDLSHLTLGAVGTIAGTADAFQGSLLSATTYGEAAAAADLEIQLDLWLEYRAGEDLVPQTGFTCSPYTLPVP